jgi:Holliday junction DNA helicase RuvA
VIAHLRGRLFSLSPEEAVIEAGGVGYGVQIPLSTYYFLEGKGLDGEVSLFVYTHVREDALALFGFTSLVERQLFEKLIGVSGIGPKLGRVILSGLSPSDLITALEGGDAARLATTPGVGKKTAERMILELRDKVADLKSTEDATDYRPVTPDDDLAAALESLGYRPKEVERAVARVAQEAPEAELGTRLRLALKQLVKI